MESVAVWVMDRAAWATPRCAAISAARPWKRKLGRPPGSRTTSISSQFTPAADSGAEGLGACLFRGESRSQALGGIAFAQAVGLLCRCEDSIQEPWAKALKRLLDPRDFNKVNAAADNHVEYQPNIRRRGVSRKAEIGIGGNGSVLHLRSRRLPYSRTA